MNYISCTQIRHFSWTQEVLNFERRGQEADLDLFHHARLPRKAPARDAISCPVLSLKEELAFSEKKRFEQEFGHSVQMLV